MKILVCIKQVPDMESRFSVDPSGTWYDSGDLAWRMNEYDEYAVEQAVLIKEQLEDADITVLSIGPQRVKETIKKAMAMGCDRAVHIEDERVHNRDPFEIASLITAYASDKGFDLIFTGLQSQDRGSGQVGLLLAEMLGVNGISTVVDFSLDGDQLTVQRELEGGTRATIKAQLPALVTCQLGLNTPRYPTLPNIMKAKKKDLLALGAEQLTQTASRQETIRLFLPDKKTGGLILEGDAADLAEQLIRTIKEKTTVLS